MRAIILGGIVVENCLLVKSVKEGKDKDGKKITFNNFYLVFANGDIIPIELKNYSSQDKKNQEKLDKVNYANWIKLNTLAQVVKQDEEK